MRTENESQEVCIIKRAKRLRSLWEGRIFFQRQDSPEIEETETCRPHFKRSGGIQDGDRQTGRWEKEYQNVLYYRGGPHRISK